MIRFALIMILSLLVVNMAAYYGDGFIIGATIGWAIAVLFCQPAIPQYRKEIIYREENNE